MAHVSTLASHSDPTPGAQIARRLLESIDDLSEQVALEIETIQPFYVDGVHVTKEQLRKFSHDNATAVLRQLACDGPLKTGVARATGRLKAEQGVPLDAVLRAYRIGGRVVLARLVEAAGREPVPDLVDLASDLWRLIDQYSDALADAYRSTAEELSRRDDDTRRMLLASILDGNQDTARVFDSARSLGLPATGTFLIVFAESSRSSPAQAPSCVPNSKFSALGVRALWRADLDGTTGMLVLPSTYVEPKVLTVLTESATNRIGVSPVFTQPHQSHEALTQAKLALMCGPPGTTTVTRYEDVPIPLLLVRQPEASRQLAEQVLGPILALPARERDNYLDTLAAWYECGGSTTGAADALHYHRNTVQYRLRRIQDITGRSLSTPTEVAQLYVALEALRLTGRPSSGLQ
jgi:PucR C-terminal helix-turn-helix domain